MAFFGSQEWLDDLAVILNTSPQYSEAARDWVGDFYFVVTPGEDVEEEVTIYLNLEGGRCLDAFLVEERQSYTPEFVITGALDAWQGIITRELDPLLAFLNGKLAVQGNINKVMKNMKAASELLNSLGLVETEF